MVVSGTAISCTVHSGELNHATRVDCQHRQVIATQMNVGFVPFNANIVVLYLRYQRAMPSANVYLSKRVLGQTLRCDGLGTSALGGVSGDLCDSHWADRYGKGVSEGPVPDTWPAFAVTSRAIPEGVQ